jgi:hypothetical protein
MVSERGICASPSDPNPTRTPLSQEETNTMNKIFKRTSIAALAIAAIGTAGLANALWTDQSFINGSLNTGSLNVGWDDAGAAGAVTDNDASWGAAGGNCSAVISDDLHTVNLTIGNAYPGYQCVTRVNVHNYGTVPAKVTNVAFGAHNAAIQMLDSGSIVQTGSTVMPGAEGLYQLTVKVDPNATEAQLAEAGGSFSIPVSLSFTNAPAPGV